MNNSRILKNVKLAYKLLVIYLVLLIIIGFIIGGVSYAITKNHVKIQGNELNESILNIITKNIEFKLVYYEFLLDSFISEINNLVVIPDINANEAEVLNAKIANNAVFKTANNRITSIYNAVYQVSLYTDNEAIVHDTSQLLWLKDNDNQYVDIALESEEMIWYKQQNDNIETYGTESQLLNFIKSSYYSEDYPLVVIIKIAADDLFTMDSKSSINGLFYIVEDDNILYTNDTDLNSVDIDEVIKHKYSRDYIIDSNLISHTNWKVYLVTPIESVASKDYFNVPMIMMILLVILISLLLVAVFMVKYYTGRIKKILDYIECIGHGNFDYDYNPETNIVDEISILSNETKKMGDNLKAKLEDIDEKTKNKNQVILKYIYKQCNSHFLYNTLSIMNWIAIRHKSDDLSEAIINLSDYYKLTLNRGNNLTTIEREIESAKSYIEVINFTYSTSYSVACIVDDNIKNTPIIKLVILPFIKEIYNYKYEHGDYDGTTKLVCYTLDDDLYIIIHTDDVGTACSVISNDKLESKLSILKKRIKLTYGSSYGYSIKKNNDRQYIELIIPISLSKDVI